ncbi:MAG: hypothetical protein A3F53_01250 [Candidatus Zambryskibacteria bacterium RIFCSPHIGHO2_12_FULL_48_10]|uniref:DUF721 domain-containing protein n=1 Tax=Candidatus Zambryskibacteria bacterium RIFCSPHIGHO2_01_FULL_46_25 TaxID=1802738 RepID=A0A1G2SYW0_9BACT|nr:MAG: hypothetical protein UT57_C0039G0004 [Microgenomates group bacterium GW2011_GWC1_39_7]KKU50274.1 MAG: hypothetical protein UX71_C0002G0245 [Parcubacteria group bacterium GW2011_GWA1_47_10]OHA90042.1 MAG: hypothetical protein A2838_00180 [Candidatus Zambryskibacteria bacterium RIFCSPHIGHO2_01_FULL_46_25]OHB00709.1 MAG: hypothetical protein A3F53_01250 [Candidatus Zambryskibacteria bacterium RIFCSPHIGHO2_12_FULL_48_10]OHB06584.1 MAG: hypothetical protein A3A31_03080 [Candidatus Zambryskib
MRNLSSLLERFAKILNKGSAVKENIAETVFNLAKVNLDPENIYLKNGVLEISASAPAKNEIRLKEEIIKTKLREVYKINISRVLYK